MLLQLNGSDGGDIALVCVNLYFMRLCLYAVSSKEVHGRK